MKNLFHRITKGHWYVSHVLGSTDFYYGIIDECEICYYKEKANELLD